jgi:hypothetical protein
MPANKRINLYQPVIYQIKVPGHPEKYWTDWAENMTIRIETDEDELPVTILTCQVDQAALLGLIRRIYSLGLPLISVIYLEV